MVLYYSFTILSHFGAICPKNENFMYIHLNLRFRFMKLKPSRLTDVCFELAFKLTG